MKTITKINHLLVIAISGLAVAACSQDYLESDKRSNDGGLTLKFAPDTYASESNAIISGLRLYAFQRDGNGDGYFSHQIPVVSQTANTLKGKIRVGDWYLNMVSLHDAGQTSDSFFSTVTDYSFHQPVFAKPMQELTMYSWNPAGSGLNKNAHEIWFQSQSLPTIEADQTYTVETKLARNNTLINIDISFPYENWDSGDINGAVLSNMIISKTELRNIPSTLSWSGKSTSMVDVTLPASDVLPAEARSTYENGGATWQKVQYKGLLVPAYRGSDFWMNDGITQNTSPVDTLKTKPVLDITLLGTYTKKDGSTFEKTFQFSQELPIVPKCNMQLNINAVLQSAYDCMELAVQQWSLETIDAPISSEPVMLNVFPGALYGINPGTTSEPKAYQADFYVTTNGSITKMTFLNSWTTEEIPITEMPKFYTLEDNSLTCTITSTRNDAHTYLIGVSMSVIEPYGYMMAGMGIYATSKNGQSTAKAIVWFYPSI